MKFINGSLINLSFTFDLTSLILLFTSQPESLRSNHYYYPLLITIHNEDFEHDTGRHGLRARTHNEECDKTLT